MDHTPRGRIRPARPTPDAVLQTPAGGLRKRTLGALRVPERSRQQKPAPAPISFDLEIPKDELQEAFTLRGSRTSTPIGAIIRSAAVYGALIIAAIVIGISFYNQTIGQWVVVAAGVAAIFLRLKSSLLLAAASFMLAMVAILTVAGQANLASNYAVYAYILLGFGTFNSIFYLRGSERNITA